MVGELLLHESFKILFPVNIHYRLQDVHGLPEHHGDNDMESAPNLPQTKAWPIKIYKVRNMDSLLKNETPSPLINHSLPKHISTYVHLHSQINKPSNLSSFLEEL